LKMLKFKDEFIRHTGLMFIGMGLFNVFNLLYHLFMVRFLSPVDYGQLNTLIALFMVISVPASTVQTTVTKFISSFQAQNRFSQIKKLLQHLLILMSIIGLSFFLLAILGSRFFSSFLQISSYRLIILFGLGLFFAMVLPIPSGGLQGLQKFGSMAFSLIINGGLKFGLGSLFVFLGLGVVGAMGAFTICYMVTVFLSLIILGISLPREKSESRREQDIKKPDLSYISGVYQYFLPVGITFLCFMVLTNIDLILVKHFFTPIEAGYYSIAQVVGKIVLLLPVPVVTATFPKLSSLEGQEEKGLLILRQSLMMVLFFCVAAILLGFLFPSLIIRILSGRSYIECIPLIRFFCIDMSLFSLVLILLYYHLSRGKSTFLYPLCFLTLIQTGLIVLYHNTLVQVLVVVGLVGFCLLGVNLYLIYRPFGRRVGGP
jgi:O-antigen/teichoic acid export membrane protein